VFVGLASMLIVIASILSIFMKNEFVEQSIVDIVTYFTTSDFAVIVTQILAGNQGILGIGIIGIVALFVSSTAALTRLQDSLNQIMDGLNTRSITGIL